MGLLKIDGEGSRLLGALLNGVNKALPLLRTVEPLIKHISALFRMVHTSSFAASTQALALLAFLAIDSNANNGSKEHSTIKRRYYRALYSKLLSDEVGVPILIMFTRFSFLILYAVFYAGSIAWQEYSLFESTLP
jgi:hypothetical protein